MRRDLRVNLCPITPELALPTVGDPDPAVGGGTGEGACRPSGHAWWKGDGWLLQGMPTVSGAFAFSSREAEFILCSVHIQKLSPTV